jgi:hypothetical protein
MSSLSKDRRIIWIHVLTVISAAILIGAEVFGAAFAGGWAVANLFNFADVHISLTIITLNGAPLTITGAHLAQAVFFIIGIAVMVSFVRNARRVEPFTTRD